MGSQSNSSTYGVGQLTGVATPVNYNYDYTSSDVMNAYETQIQTLYNVFSTPAPTTLGGSTNLTQSDADQVSAALAALEQLGVNGITSAIDPSSSLSTQSLYFSNTTSAITQTNYLTNEMLTNLDTILQSFQAVGATNPTSGITLAQLQEWQDLSLVSPVIQNAVTGAVNAAQTNTSLQALVETDYIAAGNEMINGQLSSLQSALGITNNVLMTLTSLQNIRNDLVINQPSGFNDNLGISGTDSTAINSYTSLYYTKASTYFNTPVNPVVSSTLVTYNSSGTITGVTNAGMSVIQQLETMQQSILGEIASLSAVATSGVLTNPNSLYNRLKDVNNDFTTAFGTYVTPQQQAVQQTESQIGTLNNQIAVLKASASNILNQPTQGAGGLGLYSQVEAWLASAQHQLSIAQTNLATEQTAAKNAGPDAPGGTFTAETAEPNSAGLGKGLATFLLDNNSSAYMVSGRTPGESQSNLTLAITAGQGLSNTQNQDMNSQLFVFQEFYQSASSILDSLTQILEDMARNVKSQ